MTALVLASKSPWRRRMLQDAGIEAVCEASGFDESSVQRDHPFDLVRELAKRKAEAVALKHPDAWVLGADQVLVHGGEVVGKPCDPTDHFERLASLRGQTHSLVTGYALIGPGPGAYGHEVTRLTMRADITDDELRRYVSTREGSGCAGGYAAEGHGAFLFSSIDGDWFNVLGLPLLTILDHLRARGWRYGLDL